MPFFAEEDREIIVDFVNESSESIEQTEQVLLKLEDSLTEIDELDGGLIDTIFRTFHSIKGSAGFIGLQVTNKLTHHAETLLDLVRKDKIELEKQHIDIFLEVCDKLQQLLDQVGSEFSEDGFESSVENLIGRLKEMSSGSEVKPKEVQASKEEDKSSKESVKLELSDDDLITPEMVEQFIVESKELLDGLEQDLLALEETPQNLEHVESAFRALHSLKGNAGLYNFKDINLLSHKAENFLDDVRHKTIVASSAQISLILQILDFFRQAIENLEQGNEPLIPAKIGLIDLMNETFGFSEDTEEKKPPKEKETNIDTTGEKTTKKEKVGEKVPVAEPKPAPKTPPKKTKSKTTAIKEASSKTMSEVIRVDVSKLNALMDLVGEIVIAESMVYQNYQAMNMEMIDFEKALDYLQKNVREIQDLATSMRLIPLSGIFSKMKRLVRDISAKKQNKVDLEVIGGDTEVDRSVIEHISDPLVHILRNSIDHGIEMPAERSEKGKDPNGKIILEAKRVGGEIWISIIDDGRGLRKDKIVAKAKEKGLIQDHELDMSDDKIFGLIFKPGFSTVEKVTNLSGRGVGMDVVSRNIETIRGRVEVQSAENVGTTFILKIPLTTAIVDGMLMRINDSIYAIPTLDIKESLQIEESSIVNLADGQEVINVRDSLIPVIRLQELHDLGGDIKKIPEGIIVVTEIAGTGIAFLVDEIINQQQLVVKALPKYLGKMDGVSGCAILGNGDICLILDLANILKKVQDISKNIGELEGISHE